MRFLKALSFCIIVGYTHVNATVKLSTLFTDNMVLQRNTELRIWGWASKGEKVILKFNGQQQETIAKDGKWMLRLNPMKENVEPQDLIVMGTNTITIKNVLIGDVWICAGQSNMEWGLSKSTNGLKAIEESNNPLLRIFNVPHNPQMQPVEQVNAKWVISQPSTTKNISAVGYWFLSNLQKDLKIPIGFINVSYGGTPIESWLSKEALKSMPFQDKYMDADVMKAEYDEKLEKIKPLIQKYELLKDSARLANLPTPPRPAEIPTEYKGTTTIYNGEIFPLLPLAVKGIAWYQGENNAYTNRAHTYEALLTKMIALWRADFQQPQLPFIIIQLPGHKKEQEQPTEHSGIAMLREAQLKVSQKVPNTCLVTTSDCGDLDVHYTLKEPVGYRVYQAALNLAYAKKTVFTGPLYQSYKVLGNSILIDFTHKGGGLTINAKADEKLYGFAIAGEDKKFYWANAVIKNNKVEVSSPQVAKPVSVRYGWADFSKKWNLFNKEGYPASTFRTDYWELK